MRSALFGLVVAAALVAASTAGSAVKPQTFNLLEVSTSFVGAAGFDETGNTPPKTGQGFVIGSDFYKWRGTKRGAHAGTLNASCMWVTDPNTPSAKTICTAVAAFPGGKITAIGVIGTGTTFSLPIVGGTGIYTGAQGYVKVTQALGGPDSNKSNDKFVITG